MTRPHARAGQPYEYPAEPSGEQIAKELHARYFGEMPVPVQMHEPDLSLRDKFLKLLGEWK